MRSRWYRSKKLRIASSPVAAAGGAASGFLVALPDMFAYGVGAGAVGVLAVGFHALSEWWEHRSAVPPQSFLEKRTADILAVIAATLFPSDDTLQITLFVPEKLPRTTRVVPFLRFHADKRRTLRADSKVGYIATNESQLVLDAFSEPNNYTVVPIPEPGDTCRTREQREGWFQSHLCVSRRLAQLLSDRTTMDVRAIADVAVADPVGDRDVVALVSFTTTKSGTKDSPLVLDDAEREELIALLGLIGLLFSGLGP